MKEKLALNVIVKNEIEDIDRIVKKYGQYFDEICIAVDENVEEFEKRFKDKVKVFSYKWCDDFSHKRNFLAEKTESNYYMRIDCDDDIEHPELIRSSFDVMVKRGFDVVYYYYIYSRNEFGSPDAEHWRETIIKKRPDIYWKKEIHENVFVENQKLFTALRDNRVKIIHNPEPGHHKASSDRNLKFLLKEFKKGGKDTDPRTIAYLGRMYMGLGEWQRSIPFLELLTEKSGWDDDKYFGWIHLAECWKHLDNLDYAIAACNEALAINTKFPDAYLQLGAIYLQKEDFQKSLDWTMPGLVRPLPDTMFVLDSTVYGWRGNMNAALAFFGVGDFEQALKYYRKSQKLAPEEPFVKSNGKMFQDVYEDGIFYKNFLWMIKYIADRDAPKIQSLLKAIPKSSLRDERFYFLKNKFTAPKTWSDKSIVIYSGHTPEMWSPASVHQGIGGSEEAVIYLAKELDKLGYEVTVFNDCGEMSGQYEGVTYKNFFEINPADKFNIFIAWRQNIYTEVPINANKKLIWLHDIPYEDQFSKGTEKFFDKVIVLSEYHRSFLPKTLPDDKIYVSTNGINPIDFKGLEMIPRNPKRIIYASSYDRGIDSLLSVWSTVKQEVPEAELHLFYGWDLLDKFIKQGYRKREDRDRLKALMNQEGVFEHGRVGHKELLKEYAKSGVFAYPCNFIGEINCIALTKAVACECNVVTNKFAVLGERSPNAVDDDKFVPELIRILKEEEKPIVNKGYIQDNSWETVAKTWQKDIFV